MNTFVNSLELVLEQVDNFCHNFLLLLIFFLSNDDSNFRFNILPVIETVKIRELIATFVPVIFILFLYFIIDLILIKYIR